MKKKVIILGAVLLAALGGGAWWFVSKSNQNQINALTKACLNDLKATACQSLSDKGILSVENCDNKTCNSIGVAYGRANDSSRAASYYIKACDLNVSVGCSNMGAYYESGEGVKKSFKQALNFYKKACDLDESKCDGAGTLYENGQGVEQDINLAIELYSRACEAENSNGCFQIGYLYGVGEKVKQDYGKALIFYKKACELDKAVACYNIAVFFKNAMGVEKDLAKAFEFTKKSCDLDYANGCYFAAVFKERGQGVQKDAKAVLNFYSKACKLGNENACVQENIAKFETSCEAGNGDDCVKLALAYTSGASDLSKVLNYAGKACSFDSLEGCVLFENYIKKSGDKNLQAKSFVLREKICKLGKDAKHCFEVGGEYDKMGAFADAAKLYDRACELGFADACAELGIRFDTGSKAPQNYATARKYYEKACDANVGIACNNLAKLYLNGDGIKESIFSEKRYEMTESLFKKGCDLGVQESCENAKIIAVGNTAGEIVGEVIKFFSK